MHSYWNPEIQRMILIVIAILLIFLLVLMSSGMLQFIEIQIAKLFLGLWQLVS